MVMCCPGEAAVFGGDVARGAGGRSAVHRDTEEPGARRTAALLARHKPEVRTHLRQALSGS